MLKLPVTATITPIETGVTCRIVVRGGLHGGAAARLQATAADVLAGHRVVVVDLNGVTVIDATGVGALEAVARSAREAGAWLGITGGEGVQAVLADSSLLADVPFIRSRRAPGRHAFTRWLSRHGDVEPPLED
jgi:anti-anti-sigma regulatory factor